MTETAAFAAGLLDPATPVPLLVRGRTERRYAVYRNNVTIGLIRALEANFPAVRKLLGEKYFAGFARDFAQNFPPRSPLMFEYGVDFPQWLEKAEDLASYPYLGDVARLEIIWRESYHAVDAKPLAPEALSAIDPNLLFDCRFKPHPAMGLMASRFAVTQIFSANRSPGEHQAFDIAQSQAVLLTRPQHDVMIQAISTAHYQFLLALQNGASLGDATEHAGQNTDFDLSSALALLLQSGAFQSLETNKELTT